MPTTSSDFIPIAQAAKEYPTSRRTIERRRQNARDRGDSGTYQHFMVRTKDGHEFTAPSKEQVDHLTSDGRIPEWFVHREWLDKQFAKPPRQRDEGGRHRDEPIGEGVAKGGEATDDTIVSALLNQLQEKDDQIKRKDDQIQRLNETMIRLGNAFQQSAITMQELQNRLTALPAVIPGQTSTRSATPKSRKQSKPRPTAEKKTPESKTSPAKQASASTARPIPARQKQVKTKRRGIWSWLR